ncbi:MULTISPECIES: type IV pilus biogenesis/stability protein PilW [Pseudomonas]|uniref:type IV pilus biogenesis/stability protein PilW n=1 Tax=Pseudomonas TaxID=286 RepID=UPI001C7FB864|nr:MULTISPECIES: type IV pilus biogenesis/stability protein PilW [Pseudomonas]MDG9928227.1 type IV pilus biogenesis/stability protein PilW [Pseudomonas sp. GD04042]MDH0481209.1 type IV pilus biogenesis/stability protein PilW [Pseudomonas sp. GD04015]MDH0604545.1 type IV pilus biogenesis/stability protein PilW [Pseudomonas sp. GD03869]
MTLRAALYLSLVCLLAGCVRTGGPVDPMSTRDGRDAARDAYIQLGIGHLQNGSTELAKEPLRQALALDSSSAEAYATLAVVYQYEMEPKLADENYRKAIALKKGDARLLNNYGGFLFEQKRYKEAYEQYLKASEDTLYGERSRVFENLGLTAQQLGKREEAKHYFERALRMNSQRSVSLLQMGLLSFEDKDYVAARSYYASYSQQARQTPQSLLLGTRLARVFEDRDQAASLGLQLKRLYPGTPEYQQYLSEQ